MSEEDRAEFTSQEKKLKIPASVAPEIKKLIKPWVKAMNKGKLINEMSDAPEARYADMLRQLVTIAFVNSWKDSNEQIKGLRESAQAESFSRNYTPDVRAMMGSSALEFLGLNKQ